MMSEAQLIDELVTLLVGGHETTANTVSFALYRLLQRPDVVAKIRAELARVFGDGPIDPRRTGELRYLDACIKESMRLTPILPAISRPVPTPVMLRGHTIPAGFGAWGSFEEIHVRNEAVLRVEPRALSELLHHQVDPRGLELKRPPGVLLEEICLLYHISEPTRPY